MKCRKCGRRGQSYGGRICKLCRNRQVVAQRKARFAAAPRVLVAHRKRDRDRTRAWYAAISAEHRAEILAKNRKRGQKNRRRYHLRRYRLTVAEWDALFRGQGKRCAIFRRAKSGGKGWNTDHDHRTGRVRGILCCACNRGLGNLGDSPKRLRAALLYLGGH